MGEAVLGALTFRSLVARRLQVCDIISAAITAHAL